MRFTQTDVQSAFHFFKHPINDRHKEHLTRQKQQQSRRRKDKKGVLIRLFGAWITKKQGKKSL